MMILALTNNHTLAANKVAKLEKPIYLKALRNFKTEFEQFNEKTIEKIKKALRELIAARLALEPIDIFDNIVDKTLQAIDPNELIADVLAV